MSASQYLNKIGNIIKEIETQGLGPIQEGAKRMAASIAAGRAVYYFGSGHSVLPALDVFPRYGSFVGLQPVHDPRLMWFNVIGPGGTPELLWIERQEGYIPNVLRYYNLDSRDTMIVFSHGGVNAAPVEMALEAKKRGLSVIGITSLANRQQITPTHSSEKALADVADVAIDNGAPPQDSLISLPGWEEPVAAASTVTAIVISMALVAETAAQLSAQGVHVPTFISPNVLLDPDHNAKVYDHYREFRRKIL